MLPLNNELILGQYTSEGKGLECLGSLTELSSPNDTGLDNTRSRLLYCVELCGVEWPVAPELRLGEVT